MIHMQLPSANNLFDLFVLKPTIYMHTYIAHANVVCNPREQMNYMHAQPPSKRYNVLTTSAHTQTHNRGAAHCMYTPNLCTELI